MFAPRATCSHLRKVNTDYFALRVRAWSCSAPRPVLRLLLLHNSERRTPTRQRKRVHEDPVPSLLGPSSGNLAGRSSARGRVPAGPVLPVQPRVTFPDGGHEEEDVRRRESGRGDLLDLASGLTARVAPLCVPPGCPPHHARTPPKPSLPAPADSLG